MAAEPEPGPDWVLPQKAAEVLEQAELEQNENPLTFICQLFSNINILLEYDKKLLSCHSPLLSLCNGW